VRLNDILRSSYLRLTGLVLCIVTSTYILAGWVAFSAVSADLQNRIRSAARLTVLELQDVYETAGEAGLVATLNARASTADKDDVVLWLGTPSDDRLAGQDLISPIPARTGDYPGHVIGRDPADEYFILAQDVGTNRLLVGRSYEESDKLSESILFGFLSATFGSAILSSLIALLLAARSQRRIASIDRTLRAVAEGDLDSRIQVNGGSDDLSLLSRKINSALERLSATVEGIRQVGTDIAHDLRTPINRLSIRLETILNRLDGSSDMRETAEAALEESRRIIRTFDALLRISQIEAGARRERFQILPIADIASSLRDVYEAVAEDAGQTLHLSFQEQNGPCLVFGDRELLTQMFANLIENSIRYAGKGAKIVIRVADNTKGVSVTISDNGPGVPAGEHSRLLDRFYRLDKSRNSEGTGLGLSLARAISVLHGAELTLEDAEPGLRAQIVFPHFPTAMQNLGQAN